jgi:hypothetical protein
MNILENWLKGKEKAKQFCPHQFKKTIEPIEVAPVIFISRAAYNRMWNYVDLADQEVGWIGTVERRGKVFLIKEIFLLKQEVGSAECEIKEEGLVGFATEILSSREDGIEVINSLQFWGHSHVKMGTNPSSQDDSQMETFRQSGHPWFIRGILNKLGRMEFTIYLYESGIKIVDAEWLIWEADSENLRTEIEAEMKVKVTEKIYVAPIYDFQTGNAIRMVTAKRGDKHGY